MIFCSSLDYWILTCFWEIWSIFVYHTLTSHINACFFFLLSSSRFLRRFFIFLVPNLFHIADYILAFGRLRYFRTTLKLIKNRILTKLIPMYVYLFIFRIVELHFPPWSPDAKYIFDKGPIISLSDIQSILGCDINVKFDVIRNINERYESHILAISLEGFRFELFYDLFLLWNFTPRIEFLYHIGILSRFSIPRLAIFFIEGRVRWHSAGSLLDKTLMFCFLKGRQLADWFRLVIFKVFILL